MHDSQATPAADAGGVRERILDAALAILREEGIQELTQVQVSRRAGVRQSHLTYYYPKRHDLLEAVGARFVGGMEHGLRDVAAQTGAGEAEELVRRLADAIAETGHMRMFLGIVVAADREPALRDGIARHTARMQEMLAGVIGGADAEERARLLLATMWGLAFYRFAMDHSPASAPSLLASLSAPADE